MTSTVRLNTSTMTAVNEDEKIERPVSLDDVLSKFSIFGRYHVKLGTMMFLAFASNAMYCTNYVFAVEQVEYSCKHSPSQCDVHPSNLTDNFNSQCYERVAIHDDVSCAAAGNSEVVPCTEWTYPHKPSGFVEEFQIACQEWKRTLVGTVHSFAYMVGLLIIGPMSDRVGRRAALIMTGVLGGVFGLARSFAATYWFYIVCEFLESAIGDICSPAFVFVVESVAAKDRARYYMLTQFGYQAGGLTMTFIAWNFPYFRTFLRVEYTPALLFIVYLFFLDESPRWLLTKGRKDEAVAILEKAAKFSKVNIDKGMLEKVSCETDDENRDVGYVALLKTTFSSKVILKRFLICLFWWTTCTFVSYGVTINSVLLAGNKYVNYAMLTLVDVPASIIMGYVLIYFNRKKPLFASFFCAAVFFIVQPFLPTDMAWLSMLFFMAGKFMTSLFFNIVYVITSELFPTYTRNSMHALCSSLGRVGSILAPQTPLLVPYWPGFPSLLFGSMALIASLLTLLVPDTGDDALPDTIHQAEAVGTKSVAV